MPRPIHRARLGIESLESREVPATLVNPTTLTYQDTDGDDVTVKFSKAFLNAGNVNGVFTFDTGSVNGSNVLKQQLRKIDLASVPISAGTNLTTSAVTNKVHGGDGFAALGEIKATGLDVGVVSIDGDLGRVLAGDADNKTTGLASLTAQSMGRYGTNTGAMDLHTVVKGKLGSLTTKSSIKDAFIEVVGNGDGQIGSVKIGGSLIGGSAEDSGHITAWAKIGTVTIQGDVIGGDGDYSGRLNGDQVASFTVHGSMRGGKGLESGSFSNVLTGGSVKIDHDLIGASGNHSGTVYSSNGLASITVGGDVRGGDGNNSGAVFASGKVASILVGGSIRGGAAEDSGRLGAGGDVNSVKIVGSLIGNGYDTGFLYCSGQVNNLTIGGDIVGGSASGNANLVQSGGVLIGRVGTMVVVGSVIAGANNTSGSFSSNGVIEAMNDIGSLTVNGNLLGNTTNRVFITAKGQAKPVGATDVAIRSLTVKGDVENALILGGVDQFGENTNADAQIGTVTVGGDWIASSLAAGAKPVFKGLYGTGDAKMAGNMVKDDAGVISRIMSVNIAGQVVGTPGMLDSYGFVAEQIDAVKIGGTPLVLDLGAHNDSLSFGITGDLKVHEI